MLLWNIQHMTFMIISKEQNVIFYDKVDFKRRFY